MEIWSVGEDVDGATGQQLVDEGVEFLRLVMMNGDGARGRRMPSGLEGSEAAAEAGMKDGVAMPEGFCGLIQSLWVGLAFQFQNGDSEVVALTASAHQGLKTEEKAVADGGMDGGVQRKRGLWIADGIPNLSMEDGEPRKTQNTRKLKRL